MRIKAAPIDAGLVAIALGDEMLTSKQAVKVGEAIKALQAEAERVKRTRQALSELPSVMERGRTVL